MGCFPSTRQKLHVSEEKIVSKIENEKQSDKKITKASEKMEHNTQLQLPIIQNPDPKTLDERQKILSEIKITNSILVKKGLGDPYLAYEVISRLGEGTFGEVFKVKHRVSKEIRAMKVITKIDDHSIQEEKEIINEINILKNLDHPNILKVYEFFNTDKKFFIVTELCTGGELFDKITEVKSFDEHVAAHIMKQLLATVMFCHSNNVIHRDLKPENILIESQEERNKDYFSIKIIDFGTSQIFKKNRLLNKQIGTPFYIAPEVLENSYDEKCDVWSCGVIMYILLCGNPPFYGDNDDEIYDKVREAKVLFDSDEWENVSETAKNLILLLLDKNRKTRPSAEEALKHVWFKKMKTFHEKNQGTNQNNKESLKDAVNNLKSFRAEQKMQQAALAFIVHHHTKKEDLDRLRKIFQQFDEDNDGHLTKQELIKGLSKVLTPAEAITEVNKIMHLIDTDNNGFIEYEEFLRASLSKEKLLTEENLKHAFDVFDIDKSGKISENEIKQLLGVESIVNEEAWGLIIGEIDANNDGEISYDEFKKMMYGIINHVKN